MKDDNALIENSRIAQEAEDNRYTLKGLYYMLATLSLVWILNITGIFQLDKGMLSQVFVCSVTVMMFPKLISCFVDLGKPWVKYVFLFTICLISSFLGALLSYHVTLVYVLPLLFAVQYREKKVMWFTYLINLVGMAVGMVVCYYQGICDINLMVNGVHNRDWYLQEMENGLANLEYNENPVHVILYYATVPRAMILLLFVIILLHVMERKKRDAITLTELKWKSEMDVPTGLYNRGKLEEMKAGYYPAIDRIAVIFWDVNNLKTTNDTYGHSQGDRMLYYVAEALRRQANERRRVYRFGGDEFVMIIDHPIDGEAARVIEEVNKWFESNADEVSPALSSAVGYAEGRGMLVDQLMCQADANMYSDKRKQKAQAGANNSEGKEAEK